MVEFLLTSYKCSTELPFTCAASMAPLPLIPQERGDLSCGLPGRLRSQHSRPPAATLACSVQSILAGPVSPSYLSWKQA